MMAPDTYPRCIQAVSVSGAYRIRDTHPPERIRAGQVNSALDLGIKHFSCFQLVFLLGYFHPGK
jgi:hypothetical protein